MCESGSLRAFHSRTDRLRADYLDVLLSGVLLALRGTFATGLGGALAMTVVWMLLAMLGATLTHMSAQGAEVSMVLGLTSQHVQGRRAGVGGIKAYEAAVRHLASVLDTLGGTVLCFMQRLLTSLKAGDQSAINGYFTHNSYSISFLFIVSSV